MYETFNIVSSAGGVEGEHFNLILLLGFAVLGGTLGAKVFQKLRIPQVVGYIVIGILVGSSVLGIVDERTVERLGPFNMFALGLIGFLIGGELQLEVFKKFGKRFVIILFSEAITAFVVVSLLATFAGQFFLQDWRLSAALGVVLGSISSATAPAATVDVLWEYKSRGPLTQCILAIVALDDGLALILFGIAASVASVLTGDGSSSLAMNILLPVWDIFGAVAMGVAAGLCLVFFVKFIKEPDKVLCFTLALVMLIIGLSITLKVDSILAAMALGATIANGLPRRSHSTFELVEKFVPPIYVLFFVLVGARLHIASMPLWVAVLAIVYVVGRTAGKMGGAWLGGRLSGSPDVIRRYLGYCLFSQAGVAVGLSILASNRFEGPIGQAVIMVVTATTFVVQLIGPGFVKLGIKRAGEIGMNVTEEDLIAEYKVGDVMDSSVVTISPAKSFSDILVTFSNTDYSCYPVVDDEGRLAGSITLSGIKQTLSHQGQADWLLACDLMEPVTDHTFAYSSLGEALGHMDQYGIDYMPVVEDNEGRKLIGILNRRAVKRRISAELLRREQLCES
jgi:Kef-type K+ transport system membrane component KefB